MYRGNKVIGMDQRHARERGLVEGTDEVTGEGPLGRAVEQRSRRWSNSTLASEGSLRGTDEVTGEGLLERALETRR